MDLLVDKVNKFRKAFVYSPYFLSEMEILKEIENLFENDIDFLKVLHKYKEKIINDNRLLHKR